MGSSSKTTDSSGSVNQNTSITPTNPSFVTNGLTGLGTTVSNLNNLDPYSLVSGPNADQTRSSAILNGPAGVGVTSNGDLGGAADILRGTVGLAPTISNGGGAASMSAAQIAPLISQFENPNLSMVVNPSLAAFDFGAGQSQAQQALTQAGTDAAFGGSGAALAKAATDSQLALQRGQLASGLYGNAFDSALSGATNQAGMNQQAAQENAQLQEAAMQRAAAASQAQAQAELQNRQIQQSAATGLGNLGLAYDQNARANAGALADVGNNLRGIQQEQLTAPISTASALAGIWGQMPLSLLHGQDGTLNQTSQSHSTETTTPSLMDQIGAGLGLAGSIGTGLAGLGVPMPNVGSMFGGGAASAGAGPFANVGGSFMPSNVNFLGSLAG